MGTFTVRVPAELKGRMNKHGKIDWSKVACSAFETVLIREERKQAIIQITNLLESDNDNWDGAQAIRRWRERYL